MTSNMSVQLRRLSPRLRVVDALDGDPSAANGGLTSSLAVVEDGPRLWLVGAGPTPRFGHALREALGRPVTDLVFTRPHGPLVLGAAAFGARRWALGSTAAAMARDCAACRADLAHAIGPDAAASLLPALIRLPEHRIDPPGGAHGRLGPFLWRAMPRAVGQPVLVLKIAGTGWWVAQGFVWPGAVPDLRGTGEAALAASWQRLHDAMDPTDRLLGERGEPGTRADLRRHTRYLQWLQQTVDAALAAGRSAGEAALEVPAPALAPGQAARHALNAQRVWRVREEAWLGTEPAPVQPVSDSSRRNLR